MSGFFRPWHVRKDANKNSKIDVDEEIINNKCEENNETDISSSRSTMASLSDSLQISRIRADRLSQQSIVDSISSNVDSVSARRDSEYYEDISVSTTSSVKTEIINESISQDTTNDSFAFHPQLSDNHLLCPNSNVVPALENQPAAEVETDEFSALNHNLLDYLSIVTLQKSQNLATMNNESYFVPTTSTAAPSSSISIPMAPVFCYSFPGPGIGGHVGMYPQFHSQVDRQLHPENSHVYSQAQPGVQFEIPHGIHPGLHLYPGLHPALCPSQQLYSDSVQKAVEMVNRQDAAAKQIKKSRVKKFRCERCDMAFSNNGQLQGHIRIHTGERPFKCDMESCGKSFTRNEELTRHKRIHTGDRPHSCIVCGKRFGRKDHLKKHTKTHDVRETLRASINVYNVQPQFQQAFIQFPPYSYAM